MTNRHSNAAAKTFDGKLLLGWMKRDEAVTALCDACSFDPPLTKSQAEDLWQMQRKKVEELPERPHIPIPELQFEAAEQAAADEFLSGVHKAGAKNVAGIIKIRPGNLLVHQLHLVADISGKYDDVLKTKESWAQRCLGIGMLAGAVPISQNGTKVVAQLPHAEYRGVFTSQGNLNIVESHQMIGIVRVLGSLWLSSGYHRVYAALCAANTPILAALVTHPAVSDLVTTARAPRLSDYLDPVLATNAKFWRVRYELQADLATKTSRVVRFKT